MARGGRGKTKRNTARKTKTMKVCVDMCYDGVLVNTVLTGQRVAVAVALALALAVAVAVAVVVVVVVAVALRVPPSHSVADESGKQ